LEDQALRTALRILVSLGTVLALSGPSALTVAAAGISLNPNSGAVGTQTTVSGSGFNVNATVSIFFNSNGNGNGNGNFLGSQSSDGSGNLPGVSVTIPNVTGGNYQIVATDGVNRASTGFSVPSSLTLSPTSGATGSGVTVTGTGFFENESIIIGWDQPGNQLPPTNLTANGNGGFSTNVNVPSGASNGNHTVFATGVSSRFALNATFNVNGTNNVGGANLTLSPGSGPVGTTTTVSLNGTGFNASEQVNLAVDGGGVSSVTSDGNGNFSTTVQMSSSLGVGAHTISATGASSGHSASVTFFVTAGGRAQAAASACGANGERPGNGFGDDNHCHTGSQGNHQQGDGDDGHGHSNHGGDHGDGNDQGQDD
jgi:hypothetical protein